MADLSNRTGGHVLVSVFGKDITSKKIDIYQALITTTSPMSMSIDGALGGGYEFATIKGKDGSILSQVTTDENESLGEINLSMLEDFNYVGRNAYGNSKHKIINMIRGESFKDNSSTIVPIGTNGTDKGKSAMASAREMNLPCSGLLYFDGRFIKNFGTADKDGIATFRRNPFESSFNQTHKTFCLEVKTVTNSGFECKMLPIIATDSIEWAEGDMNELNIKARRGCDIWYRDDFWTEVHEESNVVEKLVSYGLPTRTCRSEVSENSKIYNINCDMLVKEFYVNYIVANSQLTKQDGDIGDLACLLGSNGEINILIKTQYGWDIEYSLTEALSEGTRLKSNKLKDENGTRDVNVFVGITSDKTAIRFSTDPMVKKYYAIVYDLDKSKNEFEEYFTM
ncbi:MAG: hypothetical protein ACRCZ0_05795 [Cetobacterium sp.]